MIVFDKYWFQDHQKKLVWLANNFFGRKILQIDKDEKRKIIGILPNAIYFKGEKETEYISEFRTTNTYAKSLYKNLLPFWKLIHWFDINFANNFIPKYNLGFDTLTSFSESHSGGNSIDGFVQRTLGSSTESFSNIRNGLGNAFSYDSVDGGASLEASSTMNEFKNLARNITTFLTTLPSNAIVTGAVLSLFSEGFYSDMGHTNLNIVPYTGGANSIENSDYGNFGATKLAECDSYTWNDAGDIAYVDFTITDLTTVNKNGVSKYGQVLEWDRTNSFGGTWTSTGSTTYVVYFSEFGDISKTPKLTVVYNINSNTSGGFLSFF